MARLTSPRHPPKAESLLKYDFEKLASHASKIPRGYVFVPKGDVYITRHCRTLTEKLGQTLYVVYDDATCERLGLGCPGKVFEEVNADAVASAPGRREAVQSKDLRDDKKTRATIRRLFPHMPIEPAEAILEHGFQKGSGRVGRTTTLDEDHKVKLAVEAHIRHTFTPYDSLLRERKESNIAEDCRRERTRATVRPLIQDILAQWRSEYPPDVVLSTASSSIGPAAQDVTVLTESTPPIVGDAVTRNYYMKQAAVSTSKGAGKMIPLDSSIHARGIRGKIHKWNEDPPQVVEATTETMKCTSEIAAELVRSVRKRPTVAMVTPIVEEYTPTEPKGASVEAKRTREGDRDAVSTKRPRYQAAAVPQYEDEATLRDLGLESHSVVESNTFQVDANLNVSFHDMHLDDGVGSLQHTLTNDAQAEGHLPGSAVRAKAHSDMQQNTLENEQYDENISQSVVHMRNILRLRLLKSKIQSSPNRYDPVPGTLEEKRLHQIRAMFKDDHESGRQNLKIWLNDFRAFAQFSKSQQRSVILAEFCEHLLYGRMLYDLILVDADNAFHKDVLQKFQLKVSIEEAKKALKKAEGDLNTMIGLARKDFRMITENPYYENSLSAERSWAAWLILKYGPKSGLREALRNYQDQKSRLGRGTKEKPFEILDDEEEEESEISDSRVVSHSLSSLSEQPVRRPGQDRPPNPFLAQPRRETGLDAANKLTQSEGGNEKDKENSLAVQASLSAVVLMGDLYINSSLFVMFSAYNFAPAMSRLAEDKQREGF
ncbi:hypothetical protein MMC11_004123 [Xylographa trunciseda]|nr:hypothetical protein [Xylographa trunciseda]